MSFNPSFPFIPSQPMNYRPFPVFVPAPYNLPFVPNPWIDPIAFAHMRDQALAASVQTQTPPVLAGARNIQVMTHPNEGRWGKGRRPIQNPQIDPASVTDVPQQLSVSAQDIAPRAAVQHQVTSRSRNAAQNAIAVKQPIAKKKSLSADAAGKPKTPQAASAVEH